MLKDLLKQWWETVGGLSEPSKMPCYSYSIPTDNCKKGMKLAQIKNSVCSKCYCHNRGNYRLPWVKKTQQKRLNSINNPKWVESMTGLIKHKEYSGYFRFFDSGDIQSVAHLKQIVQIARNLPRIKFWLPTKEYGFIQTFLRSDSFPKNLTVRLSAYMIEGKPPTTLAKRLGVQTSTVSKTAYTCPASKQGNQCLTCRKCWNKKIENIAYKSH